MANKKSIGLKSGPNEFLQDITQYISVDGYKRHSEDVSNPYNVIESGNITMKDVDFPVLGTDNLGNSQMMFPENDYQFPGNQVTELPMGSLGGPIKSIVQAAVKKFPAIQKAIGKNYDEAVEYFSGNIDEFKNYLRSYTDEAESILPTPITTDISPTLKLPFNQRGQIIPQQHMTSGRHSANPTEALDHIYGDGPMWFAPTGDKRYINRSMNSEAVSGLGKTTQKSFNDFIGNTGKQGFDEFPLTEAEKLKTDFGGYHPKVVNGEFVPNLDDPIMRTQGRVKSGTQNTIEGIFNPDSKIKIIDGKPSRLGHSLEGNWDGTKIGKFQDEGYDIIQVIDEFTGDQLENILLPNSKHKFKVTKIDDMPVHIDNPEFKYGGDLPQAQFGLGGLLDSGMKLYNDPEYKWTDALYDQTLAPLSHALDVLSIPGAMVGELGESITGRGDGEFNFTDAMPGFKGDYSFTNMNDTPLKDLAGLQDDAGNPLVENFWGALALNIATDPSSYVGAGVLKAALKKGITKTAPIIKSTLSGIDDATKLASKNTDEVVKKIDDFKSEIDWGKWNKDIPKNKGLLDEYSEIEKLSKADGTWMKNADGSAFTLQDGSLGTVEQFVQTNSKNFKKAYPNGFDVTYRGAGQHIPDGMRGQTSSIYNNDVLRPEVGDGLLQVIEI